MIKNFPKLMRQTEFQEAQQISSRITPFLQQTNKQIQVYQSQTAEKQRLRKTSWRQQEKINMQRNNDKNPSKFLRNYARHKTRDWYLITMKEKEQQCRTSGPVKMTFQSEGKIKAFRQTKAKNLLSTDLCYEKC